MVRDANYLTCIFMNFNENIKNGSKSVNKHFLGPIHRYDTVIALVIYHVTNLLMSWTYLKFFISFEYSVILIIMLKTGAKIRGKLLPMEVFFLDYKIFHAFRTNFHGFLFGQRDYLNAVTDCPQQ